MNRTRPALTVAAAVLALTGCGATTPEAPAPDARPEAADRAPAPEEDPAPAPPSRESIMDEAYLEVLRDKMPRLSAAPDRSLIAAGRTVCDSFRKYGVTPALVEAARVGFIQSGDFTSAEAGTVFGAATYAYCRPINRQLLNVIGQ